ncbi:S8 family serine peptidase [Sphingomonas sp. 1P06PA]|uniref:S8 family peptidase n=1 Tax=Sphingomonas sp. 1P06PA TaxID=554121 RepID=UPI0039A41BA3
MATRNIIIELQATPSLVAAFGSPTLDAAPDLGAEIAIDPAFPPTQVPQVTARTPMEVGHQFGAKVDVDMAPEASTYIVRATVEEGTEDAIAARGDVVGVYADVAIQPMQICPGSPPMGSHTDVERLLCTSRLRQAGATGSGVLVAIVDTGVNMNYLNGKGKHPQFDAARSWAPRPAIIPGQGAVGHGTMCAFDVCIAAPNCTLLDIALLASNAQGGTVMEGLLSDAVRAYSHLCTVMAGARRPGENASMVVNNSWGMFHPSWDYPRGHPGNYSHNPNHPFNRIVGALERLGADILFAAGNCGAPCPDGRCQGVTGTIYGANSHPSVLTVAGVDTSKTRVGYSNQGPGALVRDKPDVCGYTHFAGSGVYAADGGTSAATPVVAGLVAAIRSRRPYIAGNASRTPTAIRDLLRSTAQDLGTAGFDLDHGFGVVNGCTIAQRLQPIIIDICRRIPRLCGPRPIPIDICKRYPWICRGIPEDRFPIPEPGPIRRGAPAQGLFGAADDSLAMADLGEAGLLDTLSTDEVADLFYTLGLADGAGEGRSGSGGDRPAPSKVKAAGCGCGGA